MNRPRERRIDGVITHITTGNDVIILTDKNKSHTVHIPPKSKHLLSSLAIGKRVGVIMALGRDAKAITTYPSIVPQ